MSFLYYCMYACQPATVTSEFPWYDKGLKSRYIDNFINNWGVMAVGTFSTNAIKIQGQI